MARTYRRDNRGRFSGGGGSSGGGGKAAGGGGSAPKSKSATTRAANKANSQRLKDMGQTAIGGRLRKSTEKSFSGTKATKAKQAQLLVNAGNNKRNAVRGESVGANFSEAKQRGTMSRKRK